MEKYHDLLSSKSSNRNGRRELLGACEHLVKINLRSWNYSGRHLEDIKRFKEI